MELEELAAMSTLRPHLWAKIAMPWNEGSLEGKDIRSWQSIVFSKIEEKLANPETRHQPIKISVGAGHGIGKSAFIGMFANWALSTKPRTRIVVTSNTETQMRTKTMPEVLKWFQMSLTSSWFEYTATSFMFKEAKENWRLDFVPWSEHNTEAFAGMHNEGNRLVLIFDEASAIADRVWEVAEGALTDENTEIIWVAMGNMTRNTGRFFQCMEDDDWISFNIDSRTVEGTNKKFLEEFVAKHGEDSDIARVRVRGLPPLAGEDSFISRLDVERAMSRTPEPDNDQPLIISVDPSWTGGDDFVIAYRRGFEFKVLEKIPSNDNDVKMQNLIAKYEKELGADAVFVDEGYGTGILSIAHSQGLNWLGVKFGGGAQQKEYLNKRAELWGRMKQWIREGGCLPKSNSLLRELTTVGLVPRVDNKIQIESKINLKRRGINSPNVADALAISFAYPVSKRDPLLEEFNRKLGIGDTIDDYR